VICAFEVAGAPVAQGNHRIARGGKFPRLYDAAKGLDQWRALVAYTAKDHAPDVPVDCAVALHITFWLPLPKSAPKRRRIFPTKKPDFDKLARGIADALTGVIYKDDSLVVDAIIRKRYAYDRAVGCSVIVDRAQDSLFDVEPPRQIEDVALP
jgi:crossover junction endodeoxyribonuclease RusA